jgi:thiamine pyrophosphokinase
MTAKKIFKSCLEFFLESYQIKSILCLNGSISKNNFSIINAIKKLPIIATDGAYKKLKKINFLPDVLIGDLDSCGHINDKNQMKVIFDPCQKTSDFQKALKYTKNHGIYPFIITGLNGGNLDHIIGNINILSELKDFILTDNKNCLAILLAEGQNKTFDIPINTRISIFPITSAKVNTEGLNWNLDNLDLFFGKTFSLSNFSVDRKVNFQVINGKILIFFYFN